VSDALSAELARYGLRIRGNFAVETPEALGLQPAQWRQLPAGHRGAVMCLVGVVGSEFWPHFQASQFFSDGMPDPLDRWSRFVGDALAQVYQGLALYPFDGPPWYPFQQWADACEATQPSKMMLRIHPELGLWHAYRFALLLPAGTLELSTPIKAADMCANCATQACLRTCPVQAYTGTAFAVDECAGHLQSSAGTLCMMRGCQARLACPHGVSYRYKEDHAAFHMQAFLAAHSKFKS